MSLTGVLLAVVGCFAAGELVARLRAKSAVAVGICLLGGAALACSLAAARGALDPVIALAPGLVAVLGIAAMLARPPTWREPRELGRLTETALLLTLCFAFRQLPWVALLWLLSLLPGLRHREHAHVSRRAFVLIALPAAMIIAAALAVHLGSFAGAEPFVYLALVVGAALRMGVPPFTPLLLASTERLPLGRAALVMAGRPSLALLLAARLALPEQVAELAPWLQGWAASAALLAGLHGLSPTTPRRSLRAMAATQASIILYGLVSPGESGVLGALVQWAGLGLSLLGLGLLVEAVESRVGHQRANLVQGLLGPAPGMALLFLLFASTLSGFPGTSGFVGEDLVMQAPAQPAALWRGLLLVATALNGITMLRMFARRFLGPLSPPEARGFPGMNGRERLVLGAMALALAVLTAWPGAVFH